MLSLSYSRPHGRCFSRFPLSLVPVVGWVSGRFQQVPCVWWPKPGGRALRWLCRALGLGRSADLLTSSLNGLITPIECIRPRAGHLNCFVLFLSRHSLKLSL